MFRRLHAFYSQLLAVFDIYIYIYIERERERHKDSKRGRRKIGLFSLIVILLHCALCFPVADTFFWCCKSRTKGKLGYSVIFLNCYL